MRNINESLVDQMIAVLILAVGLSISVLYVAVTGGRGIGQTPQPTPFVRAILARAGVRMPPSAAERARALAKAGDLPPGSSVIVSVEGRNYLCKPLSGTMDNWNCT